MNEKARQFWKDQLSAEPRDYDTRNRLARLEVQEGNELAAWELLEECFSLVGVRPTVPLRTSSFAPDECITALEFSPQYAAFRKRYPVSGYWDRSDPLYDLPHAPPVSEHIEGALTTFLAIPFGLGLKFLERSPAPRANKETLIGFFDALRPHVERALVESARELAALIPPKELGAEATASKLTEVIMFLGLVALREFGRQRGWIAGRLQIPTEVVNDATNCYDEAQIHKNVLSSSLIRINREVHFAPE